MKPHVYAFVLLCLSAIIAFPGSAFPQRWGREAPERFPRRIWFACDFEGRREDVVWYGDEETGDIPSYPGNAAACRGRPVNDPRIPTVMITPVGTVRVNEVNSLYFRYRCESASRLSVVMDFDGTTIAVNFDAPDTSAWSGLCMHEIQLDDGLSLDGMTFEHIRISAHPAGDGGICSLIVDDVICFSGIRSPLETPVIPFPRRVMRVWTFDAPDDYHPWTKEHYGIMRDTDGGARGDFARSVPHPRSEYPWIRLIVEPLSAVGGQTMLSFRHRLAGGPFLQVMMFDATIQDNRTIRIDDPVRNEWTTSVLDFTRDGRCNSGNQRPFTPGNRVDDIFFFPGFEADGSSELLLDEVVLFDGGGD